MKDMSPYGILFSMLKMVCLIAAVAAVAAMRDPHLALIIAAIFVATFHVYFGTLTGPLLLGSNPKRSHQWIYRVVVTLLTPVLVFVSLPFGVAISTIALLVTGALTVPALKNNWEAPPHA